MHEGTAHSNALFAHPPTRIETLFDFAEGLQEALRDAMKLEDSGVGDSEGGETYLEDDCERDGMDKAEESDTPAESLSDLSWDDSIPTMTANLPKQPKKIGHNQAQKKKARAKARRNAKRRLARLEQDAFDYRPPLYMASKLGDIELITCDISADQFERAKGAWIARGMQAKETKVKEIEDLLADGLRLIKWDGIKPMVGLDKEGRVVAIFAGAPTDETWQKESVPAIQAALSETSRALHFGGCECLPDPPGGSKDNRRGPFKTAATGVSFGGGQQEPGNLKHTPHNIKILRKFLNNSHVQRAMKFGSSSFAYFAPWLYSYYAKTLRQLFRNNRRLRRLCKGSIFPAISLNFGPDAVSFRHKDHGNLADGLCWIMACGDFNPRLGGHLILWELGLVVEFPPGASVLIPSAVVSHENTAIQEGESRSSITQYAAGGLFRWVEYGFKTGKEIAATDPDAYAMLMKKRAYRWKETVNLFSLFDNLVADHQEAFYAE